MNRFLKNLKMTQKLLIAPLVIFFFLMALSLIAYYGLSNQRGAIDDIFNNRINGYQNCSKILNDMALVHANIHRVISWTNAKYDKKKIEQLSQGQAATIRQAIELTKRMTLSDGLTPEEKRLYQTSLERIIEYQKEAAGALDTASSDLNIAATHMETAEDRFQAMTKHFEELLEFQRRLSRERYDFSLKGLSLTIRIYVGILMIAVVVSLLASFLMAKRISAPLMRVINGLSESSTQVVSASAQISSAGQSLAETSSKQASGIEEVSSSLEEIASITRQNSDNAQRIKGVMNEASQIIKKVQSHMSKMGQAIGEITAFSEETSKIVKTTDEIAFQTNLLALNAAVEAARAGEAGAGFSVVANEVRNLAMRASEAAKNTGHLIENTIKAVKNGKDLAQATQDAFKENIEIAVKHTRLTDEIAVASQEQALGIEQVATAVAQMNQLTQASAASAEESASAGEELNGQVEQVKSMIQELAAILGGLKGSLKESVSGATRTRNIPQRRRYTTADLLHPGAKEGQAQVTVHRILPKQTAPKKAGEGKQSAQENPKEVIPLEEYEEKDQKVLKAF